MNVRILFACKASAALCRLSANDCKDSRTTGRAMLCPRGRGKSMSRRTRRDTSKSATPLPCRARSGLPGEFLQSIKTESTTKMEPENKAAPTVIFHSADFDGIFCREIARKFLSNAKLIGWNFGDRKISVPEGQFYILDLSPECLEPDTLPMSEAARMVWIDHHKSSIAKFPEAFPGYRIDGVAACRLTWQWFTHEIARNVMSDANYLPTKEEYLNRNVVEPYAVRLAGEYDVWDKRDPRAELFQHGLRSCELTDEIWRDLFSQPYDGRLAQLLVQARSIQYSKNQENESIIKTAGFDLDFEGLHFLACNHARYNSLLFTAGLKPEHDACLGFSWRGGKWTVSLYHAPGNEHHDLSVIAVKHGGGGHRGACGFTCKTLPFGL